MQLLINCHTGEAGLASTRFRMSGFKVTHFTDITGDEAKVKI